MTSQDGATHLLKFRLVPAREDCDADCGRLTLEQQRQPWKLWVCSDCHANASFTVSLPTIGIICIVLSLFRREVTVSNLEDRGTNPTSQVTSVSESRAMPALFTNFKSNSSLTSSMTKRVTRTGTHKRFAGEGPHESFELSLDLQLFSYM